MGGLGDVPSDYGPPYAGTIFAPYDTKGPLGAVTMPNLTGKTLARAQFMQWLKDTYPDIFTMAVNKAEDWKAAVAARTGNPAALSGLRGLGQETPYTASGETATDGTTTTWWQTFVDTLPQLGTAYLAYKGQQNVLQTNIQRAQMGLPPIDPATGAPVVQTSLNLSPQLMARLQSGAGTMLLWGGAAVLGVVLLSSLMRRSRR
jgi:hypothetical protein